MKTIVWDVDDVLNDLMKEWYRWWLISHPECRIRYEDLTENPPHRLLNIPLKSYLDSLDEFRLENGDCIMPVTEVVSWFNIYGQAYRHIALSSTPGVSAPVSSNWVLKHYGNWIRSYNFIPSYREKESMILYDKNKADFLEQFKKTDLFIDDNIENINEVNGAGIKALVMPRPWNGNKLSINEFLKILTQILEAEQGIL